MNGIAGVWGSGGARQDARSRRALVPAVVEQSAARSGGGPLEPRLSGLYLLPLRVMSERICCSRPRTKLRAYARLAARRPSLGRWPWALGCCWPGRRPRRHQLLRDQRCITTSESAQRKSAWGSHEVTVMVDVSRLSQCEAAAPTRFWRSILRHRSHPPHRSPGPCGTIHMSLAVQSQRSTIYRRLALFVASRHPYSRYIPYEPPASARTPWPRRTGPRIPSA